MDTREKIVSADMLGRLLGEGDWIAVSGFFDPLTAEQAARLAGLRRSRHKLLAVVLPSDDSLLAQDARAALVAALGSVDAVSIAASNKWQSAIPPNARVEIVEDLEAEKNRRDQFVRFVLNRISDTGGADDGFISSACAIDSQTPDPDGLRHRGDTNCCEKPGLNRQDAVGNPE